MPVSSVLFSTSLRFTGFYPASTDAADERFRTTTNGAMTGTRHLSEIDALAFGSLGGCIFFAMRARRKIRTGVDRFVAENPVPQFSFLRYPFFFPFRRTRVSCAFARFSIHSRDNEVLIVTGYRHERRIENREQLHRASSRFYFFQIYINIYIYIFLLGSTGELLFTVNVAPSIATR